MAAGIYVWVAIKGDTYPTDDDHVDTRTVSAYEDTCREMVAKLGLTGYYVVPRLLILKGRMRD